MELFNRSARALIDMEPLAEDFRKAIDRRASEEPRSAAMYQQVTVELDDGPNAAILGGPAGYRVQIEVTFDEVADKHGVRADYTGLGDGRILVVVAAR